MDKFEDEVILLLVVLGGHVVQHVGPTEVKQRVDQHISISGRTKEQHLWNFSSLNILWRKSATVKQFTFQGPHNPVFLSNEDSCGSPTRLHGVTTQCITFRTVTTISTLYFVHEGKHTFRKSLNFRQKLMMWCQTEWWHSHAVAVYDTYSGSMRI